MNDRMSTEMADATRLTHQGRLIEATAIIQRTLQGILAPEASSNPTDRTTDEPVDVTFRVVDEVARPAEMSGRDHQTNSSAVAMLPSPDVAVSPDQCDECGQRTNTPPDSREEQHGEASSTIQPPWGSVRTESMQTALAWSNPFRPTLRLPQSGLGRPISTPMSNRMCREIWAGGQFIEQSYTNHAGTRTYKLYIPSGYRGQPLPLVVMLHGCTQTPDDFAAGTRMNVLAEREPFFVVYPAQAIHANQSKCWNWFKETDQHRDRGEPTIIAGITQQIVSTYDLNARRVYVAGLSAGGAMAAIMAVSYPDLYTAIGVHSGLAYGAAHDLPSALAAMQHGWMNAVPRRDSRFSSMGTCGPSLSHPPAPGAPRRAPSQAHPPTPSAPRRASSPMLVPMIVFHGDQDMTVHPRNGDQLLAQWMTTNSAEGPDTMAGADLRETVKLGQVPDGHAYTRFIYHDAGGHAVMERWLVHGAGHGWSGGSPHGSFTDPKGPDASQEMVRFFNMLPLNKSSVPSTDDGPDSAP